MSKKRRTHKNHYKIWFRRCPKVEGCKILTKHVTAMTSHAARNKTSGIVIRVKKVRG